MRIIAITVGGGDDSPDVYANAVSRALQNGSAPETRTGLSDIFTAALFEKLIKFSPNLIAEDKISRFSDILTEEYIQNAIASDKIQLLSPSGLFVQNIIRLDPLQLRKFFIQDIFMLGKLGRFNVDNGVFLDPSGKYSLVLARSARPMTDSKHSVEIMNDVRNAVSLLPKNVESYINASYAHTEDNANIIKNDLSNILPASFTLLTFLLIIFMRNMYFLLVLCIPVISLIFSVATLSVTYTNISGIVLSFGSVILGISADYAIHAYYALTSGKAMEEALSELFRTLLACALTTLSAFASLFFSDIPAVRQMALFGISGILLALGMSIFVLPHFINAGQNRFSYAGQPGDSNFRLGPTFAATVVFIFVIAIGADSLSIDGDIRNLAWKSGKLIADEEKTRSIWKISAEPHFIVSSGVGDAQGMEDALRVNDNVWALLKSENIDASSIAPLLPSKESQFARSEAWRSFWMGNGRDVLTKMKMEQTHAGFARTASEPFVNLVNADAEFMDADILRGMGFGFFLDMFVTRTEKQSLVYTILPSGEAITQPLRSQLYDLGALLVSGEVFRQKMAAAIQEEIASYCGMTLFVTLGVVILLFRTPRRCLPALLPMFAALAATMLCFLLFDIHVNIFHAVSLPLVIALSVDYGIFMQSALEKHTSPHVKKGILLSAMTTLSGFGCLLAARHPALHSIGLAVTVGIAAAMASAVWLLPRLSQEPKGMA